LGTEAPWQFLVPVGGLWLLLLLADRPTGSRFNLCYTVYWWKS